MDKALVHFKWDELQAELNERRAGGELVGCGLGVFVEESGKGPVDGARISVDINGDVEVLTGGALLDRDLRRRWLKLRQLRWVLIITKSPYSWPNRSDPVWDRAHAARATVMTGSAVNITALKVREKALDAAAELLQTTADRLDIENSEVFISDNRNGPSVSLAEIAERLAPGSKNLGGREPNLSAEGFHNTKERLSLWYPFCCRHG